MTKRILVGFATFLCLFLIGCQPDHPSEGKEIYDKTMGILSPIEKVIYLKVANQWDEPTMRPLRDAILQNRKTRPNEGAIPFADVANVIVYINDVAMRSSYKYQNAQYRKSSFEEVNPIWYEQITQCAQSNCECNYNTLAAKKKQAEVKKEEAKPVDKTEVNIDKVETKALLSYEEYDLLMKEVKKCQYASDLLLKKLREQRFLFVPDREEIMKEVMLCKSMELQNQLMQQKAAQ